MAMVVAMAIFMMAMALVTAMAMVAVMAMVMVMAMALVTVTVVAMALAMVMVMTVTVVAMVVATAMVMVTVNTLSKLNKMTQNPLYVDHKINQLEKERMQSGKLENSRPISVIEAELRSYRAIQSGNHNNTEFTHTFINGGQVGQRNTTNKLYNSN
jgi:hypothetical protein